jgi:hypothetical protein
MITYTYYAKGEAPKDVESVIIDSSVTEIEDKAFEECKSLASIVIPNSVTTIGDDAFECTSLAYINRIHWRRCL